MEAATIKTIYVPILGLFLEKLSQIMTLSLPFPQEVEESVNRYPLILAFVSEILRLCRFNENEEFPPLSVVVLVGDSTLLQCVPRGNARNHSNFPTKLVVS